MTVSTGTRRARPRALPALGILVTAAIVIATAFAYGAALPFVVALLRGATP